MSQSVPVVELNGNVFGRVIYPPRLLVIASKVAKLWLGKVRRDNNKKMHGLDRDTEANFQNFKHPGGC